MGYISEHTCEYYLVTELTEVLFNYYDIVTPFYFWASREGKTSQYFKNEQKFKFIVIYPRRPRVSGKNDEIWIKLHASLFPTIKFYQNNFIPVVAGTIKANTLFDLGRGQLPCTWFEFNTDLNPMIENDVKYQVANKVLNKEFIKETTKEEIVHLMSASPFRSWVDIESIILQERRLDIHHRKFFLNYYKPVFLIASIKMQ